MGRDPLLLELELRAELLADKEGPGSGGQISKAQILKFVSAEGCGAAGQRCCAVVVARSDTAANWWFLLPPAPTGDAKTQHCGTVAAAGGGRLALTILISLTLPVGYTRLAAWLEQPATAAAPLVPAARAVLLGLGCIVAECCRSSALYQIHEQIWCLYSEARM